MFTKNIFLVILFISLTSCTSVEDPLVKFVKDLNKLENKGHDLVYSIAEDRDSLENGATCLGDIIEKAPAVKKVSWAIHRTGENNYADILAVLSNKGELSQSIEKAISTSDEVWPDGKVKAGGRSVSSVEEVLSLLKEINKEVPDGRLGVSLIIKINENRKAVYDYFGAVILDKKNEVKYYEARMKNYNISLTTMQKDINEMTPDWLVWRDLRKQ